MAAEAHGTSDILDVIGVRLTSLSPAERAVADVILTDPEAADDRTIGQLAQLAGSSEATVTRFCRSIGLPGYAQLRLRLAVALERRRNGDQRDAGLAMIGDFEPGDPLADLVRKVAVANAQAVELTVAQLDLEALATVVDRLLAARRVLTFGVGSSATVAVDAAAKFTLAGRAAQASSDVHAALMTAALFDASDIVVAFSHSGRAREAVEVLAEANARGAITVVVTSDDASPAARTARHTLVTAAREMTFRSGGVASRIAQLTVVDCVFVAMSHRQFDQSIEATEHMHEAVRGHVIGSERKQ